jgi:hypothetical protein
MPHRPLTLFVLFLLCTTFVTGLVALHGYLTIEQYPVSVELLPAVDLAAANNLSVWFCSSMLAAGAVLSLLIYQIRRYRTDDYRGRYRMWFWFAAVLMLGSVNAVADLEYAVRTTAFYTAGIPDYPDALMIGTAVTAFILLVLAVRLAIEMRSSWAALTSLTVSVACIATVLGVRLGWLWADAQLFRIMAKASLMMVGHVALFFSLCVYGSHVYREANGLSNRPPRNKKKRRPKRQGATEPQASESQSRLKRKRRPKTATTEEGDAPKKRVRQKQTEPVESRRKKQAEPTESRQSKPAASKPVKRRVDQAVKPVRSEDEESDADGMAKLSKAERRRLRKLRRRERQTQ